MGEFSLVHPRNNPSKMVSGATIALAIAGLGAQAQLNLQVYKVDAPPVARLGDDQRDGCPDGAERVCNGGKDCESIYINTANDFQEEIYACSGPEALESARMF